ncbi:hypothetical protein BO70DRAFT_354520 [Aspergillus heteromorphus CBS 117.55]|uniref:Uncharacterized protein n=1 Tax=Aspergillus heteromorphus CBS 117.55 TaxID=1448321 RepID=A0A317VPQ8_9EURO|nr:uncharacterized protein BO70DRAFT_354520 [Aspergillus heteromorphus CBS 117.55]PWY75037.1 hypothetical protein BO70DRAFT_354520 [Aspergillus heteromorphus CBS 117.55]
MSRMKSFLGRLDEGRLRLGEGKPRFGHRRPRLGDGGPQLREGPVYDLLEAIGTQRYPELHDSLEMIALAPLRADEQARRHRQQMEEMQQESSKEIAEKKEQINELMQRIQLLSFHPDSLTDEEAIRTMKHLRHRLDACVNTLDMERLEKVSGHIAGNNATFIPQGLHEVRAFITSVVSVAVYEHIFDFLIFPIPEDGPFSDIIKTVHDHCPSHVAHHWRAATSIGAQSQKSERLIVEDVIAQVASDLGGAFQSIGKLTRFAEGCMVFKQRLDRQECAYRFFRSRSGDQYVADRMEQVGTSHAPGKQIQCSLWPGLFKVSREGCRVVVPESVLSRAESHETPLDGVWTS